MPLNSWEWEAPAFDVVAHAGIILRIPRDRCDFEGRSHSLWYCDAFEVGRYEWIETAFMITPMIPKMTVMRPFMLDPGPEAAKALWVGLATALRNKRTFTGPKGDVADYALKTLQNAATTCLQCILVPGVFLFGM